MVLPDDKKEEEISIASMSPIEELSGRLKFENVDDKLLHSVLENDKQTIDEGKIIQDALNNNISSFSPDLMIEALVKDFQQAKKIYGESIIRLLSGCNANYVEKNIKLPEFQRELKKKMNDKLHELRDRRLLTKENSISEKGIELASLILYVEEINALLPTGIFGEKLHKKRNIHGDPADINNYKKGSLYRNIAVRSSIKVAARRKHENILLEDLRMYQRQQKGAVYIIYAVDASGSMKGKKIATAKKAGVALAYKATEEQDNVGLLVFGKEIVNEVQPTTNFLELLNAITTIRSSSETNFAAMIERAIQLFPAFPATKHLLILSDALPTFGENPIQETLTACEKALSAGITVSVIGIDLDKQGKQLAENIVQITNGKLYAVKNLEELDQIVLQDYYSL
ncbi:VWA domain-containing protein [Candidatus Woesearchaeota archaeon]|nr:VWA domain-containing protein [Candidatus Woesearchaeota archaeon]